MDIYYNSHNEEHKKPFGAVAVNTPLDFKISIEHARVEQIKVKMVFFSDKYNGSYPMKLDSVDGSKGIFTFTLLKVPTQDILFYYFKVSDKDQVTYYGNNNDQLGGVGQSYDKDVIPYQITVYQPFNVPKWYKEGIMYQIFVDRFNKSGDEDLYKDRENFVTYHHWDEKNRYRKNKNGTIDKWDVYGGNLRGIIDKVGYLKSLGVSILYLNPIFEANTNHKYNTADYLKVDPGYGTDDDFVDLCTVGKENKINIVLDGVFSHTGSDSIYFNRYNRYDSLGAFQSKDSPYYPWYRFTDYPEHYESWWGFDMLPNVEELTPSYLDFIVRSENSVISHWISKGASGWRLDVADELPDEFIRILKRTMKERHPHTVLIGEVWEDASNKKSYDQIREYLLGEELDSVMNYPFRDIFTDFLLHKAPGDFTMKKLMSQYENYPKESFYANMNLVGTHDTMRILSLLGEAPHANTMNEDEQFNFRLDEEKYKLARKRLKLLSLIQMTFPGVPCIYYGDEAGSQGYQDPYCRGSFPWGNEDDQLLDWYRTITQFRNSENAFKRGSWQPYYNAHDIVSYSRSYEDQRIFCFFNRSIDQTIQVSLPEGCFEDLMINEHLTASVDLPPMSGRLLKAI